MSLGPGNTSKRGFSESDTERGRSSVLGNTDNTGPILDASDAWEKCAERVWSREEAVVQKWKDEINKLLTFVSGITSQLTFAI